MSPARVFSVAVILVTFCWMCASSLFQDSTFAFRDTEYFYYPLFEWTTRQWQAGTVPLWNPLENGGVPLVADATSSVFYPFKAILLLPLPFTWNFKIFVLSHLLLAAGGSYVAARHWGSDHFAATIAAVSYAFGGNVLFQYCNVVFLIGAAWLPLAMMATDRMLARRSWHAMSALALVLAMITLGGDPQTAYHIGLGGGIYALVLYRNDRRTLPDDERLAGMKRLVRNRLTLLLAAGGLGLLLAAVQVLPSMVWSRHSERAAFTLPRSVYEIPAYLSRPTTGPDASEGWQGVSRGVFGQPAEGTHHDHIYQFSVGPWRTIEFLWPNATGRMFPENQRWVSLIPGEDRTWVPSMYMGLLPLLLAALAWRLRGGEPSERWLSWLGLLSAIGSLGWYGVGWLLIELRHQLAGEVPAGGFGEPVGGLYWLLVTLLPGYAYFRFPAKLLVLTAFAASQLAAVGWQRASAQEFLSLRRLSLLVAGVSAFTLAWVGASEAWIRRKLVATPSDEVFGPFDADGAIAGMRFSLCHGIVISVLLVLLVGPVRRIVRRHAWVLPACAVVIVSADLAVANRCLVATTSADYLQLPSPCVDAITKDQCSAGDIEQGRLFRAREDRWLPKAWQSAGSPNRVEESAIWRHASLYPKYNLLDDWPSVDSLSSISSVDFATFVEAARNIGVTRDDGVPEPHPVALDLLGVRYLIAPETLRYAGMQPILPSKGQRFPLQTTLSRNPFAFPRAWLVRNVDTTPVVASGPPHTRYRAAIATLVDGDAVRDFRRTAVVETDAKTEVLPPNLPALRESESCRVEFDSPNEVRVAVQVDAPALLVLRDFFADGWDAELRHGDGVPIEKLPIYRTNRVLRGVPVPAGQHQVVFRYRPRSITIGAALSGIAWACLLTLFASAFLRRRGRRAAPSDNRSPEIRSGN